MTQIELTAKKYKQSIIYLIIGAIIIFGSVLIINTSDFFLSAEAEIEQWFIAAAIAALAGWVIAFLGIIGIVRNSPSRNKD